MEEAHGILNLEFEGATDGYLVCNCDRVPKKIEEAGVTVGVRMSTSRWKMKV